MRSGAFAESACANARVGMATAATRMTSGRVMAETYPSSTNAFKRAAAASHCAAMWSRYPLAFSRRLRSSSQTRSRPRRAWRTKPTLPSVVRCFVIACRVTPVPSLSRVIESGPSTDRRRSRLSRVASPSAANSTGALLLRDIRREVLDLRAPPLGVHAERLGAARERDPIEPGLDDRERSSGPALSLFERELDQRHGLPRIIRRGVLRIRMPAVREIPLRLDPLDLHLDLQMLVTRNGDPTPHRLARGERTVERDAEPGAELFRIGDRTPHARARRVEHDALLDPVSTHRGTSANS